MAKSSLNCTNCSRFYPKVEIAQIKNPNRLYAIFLFGFILKIIVLIPVFIELALLGIATVIGGFLNSFYVLFTGNYYPLFYKLVSGMIRLTVKSTYYLFGLTDIYPGFDFTNNKDVKVDIPFPKNPNRWWAIPFLGGLARIILLIPFGLYSSIVSRGAFVGIFLSSIPVLVQGYYPESTYELGRDSQRVSQASNAYLWGLSDQYPSFWISFNHRNIKIILLVIGAILTIGNFTVDRGNKTHPSPSTYPAYYQYH